MMSYFAVVELVIWFLCAKYTYVMASKYASSKEKRSIIESEDSKNIGDRITLRHRTIHRHVTKETALIPEESLVGHPERISPRGIINNKPYGMILMSCVLGYFILVLFDTIFVRMIAHYVVFTPIKCSKMMENPKECQITLNIPFQHVYFKEDGADIDLHGIWVPSYTSSSSHKPLTIMLNSGSDGNLGYRYYPRLYEWLAKQGINVFAWDYPGYGYSDGVPSQDRIYGGSDSALKFIMKKFKIPSNEIIVYGFSLGGPVAVNLASSHDVRAVVLQAPLDRIGYVSNTALPLGGWLLPHTLPEQFDSIEQIKNVHCCMFFYVGTNDEVFSESRELVLYNNAHNVPKKCKHYYRLEGFDHLRNPLDDEGFVSSFSKFLNSMQ